VSAFGRTVTVTPDDRIADTLLTLSQGDTLFLSPGTQTSSLEQPLRTAGPEQSGVVITSQLVNRAVLSGQGIERSVIVLEGPFTSDVVLENLVITGGNATGTESFSGGGISDGESKAVVSICSVTGNTALIGGGIGAEGGTLHIQYTTLSNNKALVTGGGIDLYACNFSGFLLQFLNNTSSDNGGGVFCYHSSPTIFNSPFTDGYAHDDGGGIYCYALSDPEISFCTFNNNFASYTGRPHSTGTLLVRVSGENGSITGKITIIKSQKDSLTALSKKQI